MDFSFDESQQTVRELANRIFGDMSTHEHLREVETTEEHLDRKLWAELAAAGLLGISMPEGVGGAGLGLVEACIVLEEAGAAAAAVPVLESMVLGAAPIARFGTPEQQSRYLTGAATGDLVLTAALMEQNGDPYKPSLSATRIGDGYRLSGTKSYVPAGMIADTAVVSAKLDDGRVGLFLAPLTGLAPRRQHTTSGRIEADIDFDIDVGPQDILTIDDGDALQWLLQVACAGICVQVAGACQSALRLTAKYTTERVQFEKPIATFQAVGQRAADAYIDAEGVRLTAWQAVWRLSQDLPAQAEVAVAKYWADEGAQRVVHGAQHLHGGVGVDRDYPVHRYFLVVKHLSLMLGGTTTSLLRLGDLLAGEPAL